MSDRCRSATRGTNMGAARSWASQVVRTLLIFSVTGCGLGPRALEKTRLPYNEAVKVTTEEQLLLNIVRLRYTDTPSSLGVSSIAAQFELQRNLQLTPF